MKYAAMELLIIFMTLGSVSTLNEWTMRTAGVTYEDLALVDLTQEEQAAIDEIDDLMEELFVNTWNVLK